MGKAVTAVTRNREPDEREQLAGRIMRELGNVADPATCFPPLDPTVAARALAAMGGQEPDKGRRLYALQAMTHPDCKGWHDRQADPGPDMACGGKRRRGLVHSKLAHGQAAGRDLAASSSADHAAAPICSAPNLAAHSSHFSLLTFVL